MYARVNIIFGQKSKVEDGVSHLEKSDRAAVEATGGNLGLTTLVDREAGVIMAVSYWDEPAHSSEAALTRAREGATTAAGGDLVVETYEVASQERLSVPSPGATVRVGRVQIDPAKAAAGMTFIREQLLPKLQISGLCGTELLIDQDAGTGLLLTTWTSEDAAVQGDTVLEQLRDEAVERAGTKFPRVETYALVRASAPA